MKTSRLLGAIGSCFIAFVTTTSHAALIDDFDQGNLANWTIGGRQNFSWTANVVSRHGSQMGHLSKDGFTEVTLENLYDYSTDLSFMFDMEVRSYGGDGNTFYGMGSAEFVFLNLAGDQIGLVRYANTSSNYLSNVSSTRDDLAYNAVNPDVLLNYSLTMNEVISQLSIINEDIDQVRLQFRAYASGYSGGMGGEAWVDNISVSSVPVPTALWLFGSGLLGLVGISKRKKMT